MRKLIIALIVTLMPLFAHAEYGAGKVNRLYVSGTGTVYFGLDTQLANTCSNWGEHFQFESATEGGKSKLSVLLSAKMSDSTLYVWYTPSSAPGSDQSNGCSYNAMAVADNVGL